MFDKLLAGVDRALAYKLMVAHIIIIAISNYIVQFKIDIGGNPLSIAAFTFPLVVVLTDLTVRLLGKQTGRAVIGLAFIPAILVSMAVVKLGGAPDSVAFRIGRQIGYSSAGNGHPTHLMMELFQRKAGIQLSHVPYKGTPQAVQIGRAHV